MFSVLVTPAKAGVFIHIVKDSGACPQASVGVRRNDMLNIIHFFIIIYHLSKLIE